MFRFNHHHQGAYYVILNSEQHTPQYGPNKIRSHTTEPTTTTYFN